MPNLCSYASMLLVVPKQELVCIFLLYFNFINVCFVLLVSFSMNGKKDIRWMSAFHAQIEIRTLTFLLEIFRTRTFQMDFIVRVGSFCVEEQCETQVLKGQPP